MNIYVNTIIIGLIFFVVIFWFVLLYAYLREYRKNGYFKPFHALLYMSFVLYIEIAYFLTILPLPSMDTMNQPVQPIHTYMQLHPLNFLTEIANYFHHHSFTLMAPPLYTNVFNVFLLLPLGIYLNKLFNVKFTKAILITFLISLSFEIIQLSGLFFIYPYPYRVFDVNDLMFNTLGGIIGYLLANKFLGFLDKIDLSVSTKEFYVSKFKQMILFISDLTIIFVLLGIANILSNFITLQRGLEIGSFYNIDVFRIISFVFMTIFLCIPLLSKHYQTFANKLSGTYLDRENDNLTFRFLRSIIVYLPFILSNMNIFFNITVIITGVYILYFIIHIFTKKKGMNLIDQALGYQLHSKHFESGE